MKFCYLKVILWLLVTVTCVGNVAYAKPVDNLILKNISAKDGLSQNTVNTIFQDEKGFTWIGTENGINIYDGYSVNQLQGPDGDFDKYSVYDIRQGTDGLMWLTLNSKGVYTYDANSNNYQLIFQTDPDNAEAWAVNTLEKEPGISDWIITSKTGGVYDRTSQTFRQLFDLSDDLPGYDSIYRAVVIEGLLMIATRKGVYAFDEKNNLLKKLSLSYDRIAQGDFNLEEANKIYDITFFNGDIYLGSNDGVYAFKLNRLWSHLRGELPQLSLDQVVPKVGVWKFGFYQDELQIAGNDALYRYDLYNDEYEKVFSFSDALDNMAGGEVTTIHIDIKGNFWLGSSTGGAFIWNPKSQLINNYSYNKNLPNSLSNGAIFAVEQDFDNPDLLWVGTNNGLNLVNIKTGSVEQFLVTNQEKTSFTSGNISTIGQSKDYLWILSYVGVHIFDKKRKEVVKPLTDELAQWLVTEQAAIYLEKERLWYSNEQGFSIVNTLSGEIELIDVVTKHPELNPVWSILGYLPGSDTEMMLSSPKALWLYHREEKTLKKIYQAPGITQTDHFYFGSVAKDNNGVLWVAHAGIGLIGFVGDTFDKVYFYDSSNSIIDDNIYGLQLDDVGHLWFSTHDGIYRFDVNSHHFRKFTLNHGFINSEFNSAADAKLANGMLAYGGMSGLSIFDPIILDRQTQENDFSMAITSVSTLSRKLDVPMFLNDGYSVDLNYSDVGINIDFSTFDYFKDEQVLFKYELAGPDNIISPLTKQNSITFPSLSSGLHTLTVWAKSPSTGSFTQPITLRFKVSYAPWRSPVALMIYSVFIILMFTMWLRIRHVRQQELLAAHEEVKYRENRLQLALSGSNSEVWDWLSDENNMYGKRFADELGYDAPSNARSFEQHVALIHPEDRDNFVSRWQVFLVNARKDASFECTYRLRTADERWLWYRDLGKIVAFDRDRLPLRVTGSYTNVTQRKIDEERAQHYGDAFKQTKDWVLIVDENLTKVTANQALRSVFNLEDEEFAFDRNLLGLSIQRRQFFKNLVPTLAESGYWRGEELVRTPSGKEFHVIVNITVSENQASNLKHYICVFTDISAQKTAEKELRLLANYDHLTGLPNRSLLLERIKHGIDQANRQHEAIALFFIDLDKFKQINDSLGHAYGDLLLKEIAQRLTNALRADDTVARIGGDEFVVLLESFKSNNQLSRIAQQIIDVVEQPFTLKNNVVSVGASIGIAMYPDDSSNSDELLRNADVAMYHAKQLGRNNFQFFTEHMNLEAKERLIKENSIKHAVKNDEFHNVYQPLIDAHTGKAVGAELLMRWQCKDTFISPIEFIPLAEELGLIITMTDTAMSKGFEQLIKWRKQRKELYLSINISAMHFIDEGLVDFILNKLDEFDLPANALKLEVTENAFITEPEKAIRNMNMLSELGVMLALDDFGTGFSSLSYLKQLPLDIIKIDRSFVSGIGQEPTDEAIVDATLVLAKSLNMACIAEGVETTEQLQYLVERDCHYIQGYLYHPPLSEQDFLAYLSKNEIEINISVAGS